MFNNSHSIKLPKQERATQWHVKQISGQFFQKDLKEVLSVKKVQALFFESTRK